MKDIKRYLFIMAAFAAACGFVACGDGGGGGSSDGGSVRAQYGSAEDGTTITFYGNNTFKLVEASGTSTKAADSKGGNVTITEGTYTGNPVTGENLACTSSAGNGVTVKVSGGSATVNGKKLTKAVAVYENIDYEEGVKEVVTCAFFTDRKVTITDLYGNNQTLVVSGTYEGNPLQNGEVKISADFSVIEDYDPPTDMTITGKDLIWDELEFTRIYP